MRPTSRGSLILARLKLVLPIAGLSLFSCQPSRANSGFKHDLEKKSVALPVQTRKAPALRLKLQQNFPSTSRTNLLRIRFDWLGPAASEVRCAVHDLAGNPVRLLFYGSLQPGAHEFVWDGKNEEDTPMPAGRYWCRLGSARRILSKMLIIEP